MSFIKKISLTQFRNYPQANFHLDAPLVCIAGLNGVGKTNLLDAVYFLCYTKSYFTSFSQQLVQLGADGFRVEGWFQNNTLEEQLSCKWKNGKKELFLNESSCDSIKQYIGRQSAVMVAPDDIALINEGSEIRRKWVDSILAQTNTEYFDQLLKYQQTLAQRNAWLKANAVKPFSDFNILDYYDSILNETGSYIFKLRSQFIIGFSHQVSEFYRKVSNAKEEVIIQYVSSLHEKPLAQLLKDSMPNDFMTQRTLKGIHKDEFEFYFNGVLIKPLGSQGQKKSYLLALKLAQYQYLKLSMGHSPILLLDDIFEKLDGQRLASLWEIVLSNDFGQVLMTDTESDRLKRILGIDFTIENILL